MEIVGEEPEASVAKENRMSSLSSARKGEPFGERSSSQHVKWRIRKKFAKGRSLRGSADASSCRQERSGLVHHKRIVDGSVFVK